VYSKTARLQKNAIVASVLPITSIIILGAQTQHQTGVDKSIVTVIKNIPIKGAWHMSADEKRDEHS